MKSVILEVVKACLVGVLFLCAGLYIGADKEKKELENNIAYEEKISLIAVVNMDDGSDIEGEKINYGSELGQYPNENFVGASLEEAKSGIYNGTYGAYVVIPPDFSESVESINDFPQKASLVYALNPNLSYETKLDVVENINAYMSQLNDTLSYVYVTSIMEEFHDVQDGSKTILEHDIEDLNNILAIAPEKLSQDIEFSELKKTEYNFEILDLNRYTEKSDEYIANIDKFYESASQEMLETYQDVVDGSMAVSEEYENTKNKIDAFNPLKNENDEDVLETGFEKLETEAALTTDDSMRAAIDTKVSQQVQIELGYYREQLQKYSDEQLAKYIASQQENIDEWTTLNPGTPYQLETKSTVFQEMVDDVDTEDLSDDEKKGDIKLESCTPNMNELENDYPILVQTGDLTPDEETLKTDVINQLTFNNQVSSYFKSKTFDIIVPSRTNINNILEEDVIEIAKTNMIDGLNGIDEQLELNSDKIEEEQQKIAEYKPFEGLGESSAKENIAAMRSEILEMQRIVNEKTMDDSEMVSEIYMNSEESIMNLKEDMREANETTKTNVQNTINTLKDAREGLNEDNSEILEAFSERLSYTRLGTLENEQAYDFIVEPIEYTQEMTEKPIIEKYIKDKKYLIVISIICAVLYTALIITNIIIAYSQSKRAKSASEYEE